MWQQGVESICSHALQAGRKDQIHEGIVAGVDYHLILEVSNVLDWVARSAIIIKGQSCKLFRELAVQNLFREREVEDFGSCQCRSAIEPQLRPLDPSLDQFLRGSGAGKLLDLAELPFGKG